MLIIADSSMATFAETPLVVCCCCCCCCLFVVEVNDVVTVVVLEVGVVVTVIVVIVGSEEHAYFGLSRMKIKINEVLSVCLLQNQ